MSASRGLIYAMLLDADDHLRERQLAYLHSHAHTEGAATTFRWPAMGIMKRTNN